MPVPVDPGDFGSHAPITSSGQNLRFQRLYKTLDPAQIGIDDSNIKPLGIGTPSLAAKAITAAKIEDQQAWQTIAFAVGTWSGPVAYYKDSLGRVWLEGGALTLNSGGTIPVNTVLFTLPVGYRPRVPNVLAGSLNTNFSGPIQVGSDGTVKTNFSIPNGYAIEFGVSWRAEN